ncbi:MAG: indolepyruvate oxidoreductase subunit beta family protein [Pseudomonadota bacterium]
MPRDTTQTGQIIKLAIMAVGGQGGGVLTNWIVALAEGAGWHVQATAVAGVAQRTGATIYYVEMAPLSDHAPVFALAPAPGDVDILMAAEWMEAGRAILRGFVTPDRTTVIASTHRALAVSEKITPGDGHADPREVTRHLDEAAANVIAFDMDTPAREAGSVISASLFGALAGSGTLPFDPDAFRDTIRSGGRGVDRSLAAFDTGLAGPVVEEIRAPTATGTQSIHGPRNLREAWKQLSYRVQALPEPAQDIALAGLQAVVDYQDPDYGAEYLDLLAPFAKVDTLPEAHLTATAAKYIANAMTYDDPVRVADLKTRASRAERVHREMDTGDRPLRVTEFMHPGVDEVLGLLPPRWAAWIEARPPLKRWLDRRVNHGRRIRSDTILGFGMLWLVAGLHPRRRRTERHRIEVLHRDAWLAEARRIMARDPHLAAEILACRRLIKGYSDTHARGHSKFDRVMGTVPVLEGRQDAADWLRRLRDAAMQDEKGEALDGAVRTIETFATPEEV